MAAAFGVGPGGILSLDVLLEEHSEALEYDLLDLGLRLHKLGTHKLTWRELKAVVRYSRPGSALCRAMRPEDDAWQLNHHLLADIADTLHWLAWAKTKAAQNDRDRPEPIPRPGLRPTHERIGTAVDIDGINEFLGWNTSNEPQ